MTALSVAQSALGIYRCKQPFGHWMLPLIAVVFGDETVNRQMTTQVADLGSGICILQLSTMFNLHTQTYVVQAPAVCTYCMTTTFSFSSA